MCKHRHVKYLGKQCDDKGKVLFELYNCVACGSTITKDKEKKDENDKKRS
uniref:Uncharacterized protein n=1 Tax=viral metagenome TaxID=1070528 RepID=A0A6M3L576_9ZZZZ